MSIDTNRDLPDPLDVAMLERSARDGTLDRLLTAWNGLSAGVCVAEDVALRRLVLAALRLDLALLVHRPSLLFQCLYNRLFWHDSAEAAAFYASDPAGAPPLRAWVERWRRSRGVAEPWARALRPPEVPLASPLREEYREDLGHGGDLRFSGDAGAIGVVQPDGRAIAWVRGSGRRVEASDAARVLGAPEAHLEIDRGEPAGSHWGRVRVRDRRTRKIIADLAVDQDSSFGVITGVPGDVGILAAGWCGDYEGVVCRVDRPYRAARWHTRLDDQIHALAVDRTGDLVATAGGPLVHLLDGTSGAVLASFVAHAHRVALSPDGAMLATRHGDLVRVWDVMALRRGRPARLCGHDRGWVDAAFSPDGSRLLTGELLCDARDGRLVARLALDGPGYLEGGPPRQGRRLADGRFVEMSPIDGVRVLGTADGRELLADDERRYGLRDAITIAADGLHYVHGHERRFAAEAPVDLTLRRVDDGHVLADLGPGTAGCAEFSPDSRCLLTAHGPRMTLWSVPAGVREGDLEHPAAVVAIAVSHDGALGITATEDGALWLWDLVRRELLDTRTPVRPATGERVPYAWRSDPNALVQAGGWPAFSLHPHSRAARRRAGLTEIVDGAQMCARVVTHEPLIADPGGVRWASRTAHVVIEDGG